MDALTKEMGVEEGGEHYDDTALMLVLLQGRAPVYEEEEAEESEEGEPAEVEPGGPAAEEDA